MRDVEVGVVLELVEGVGLAEKLSAGTVDGGGCDSNLRFSNKL